MNDSVNPAIAVLREGGVIAYPTEFCFGLGCDPQNQQAVERILEIKQRGVAQGLILIASTVEQVVEYADLMMLERAEEIKASWPGPNTWIIPVTSHTPNWIKGEHSSVAMRVTDHPLVRALCDGFGGAIVSTSANRHGQESLVSAEQVEAEMSDEVDLIMRGDLSPNSGERLASRLIHGQTGEVLR